MSERRCLVAVCHNGPVVFSSTVKSLMEIGWGNRVDEAKKAHGFASIDFSWMDAFPRVDALRDAVAMLALQEGQIKPGVYKHRYSHVLFLDADMQWPTDVLTKMLRHHDKGIVSGAEVEAARYSSTPRDADSLKAMGADMGKSDWWKERAELAGAQHPVTKEKLLVIYTKGGGVHLMITGSELTIEKDGSSLQE